jgi:hypothetical protein
VTYVCVVIIDVQTINILQAIYSTAAPKSNMLHLSIHPGEHSMNQHEQPRHLTAPETMILIIHVPNGITRKNDR